MLTSHIHPRLGLPKFLSFEPYFKDALLSFDAGNDTLITITGGLSPNTVAARMRDSLSGLRLNGKGPNADKPLPDPNPLKIQFPFSQFPFSKTSHGQEPNPETDGGYIQR